MDDRLPDALGIRDLEAPVRADELAAVTDLAAALGVERRPIEHDRRRLARNDREHAQVVGARLVRVADELGLQRRDLGVELQPATALAARSLALLGHRRVEAGAIDRHAALRGHLDGQVDREAERVVQAERIGPADRVAGADELRQARRARLERAGELLLLGLDAIEDPRRVPRRESGRPRP